jgi:L-seryl-tRNA(Ser) seleniumtransferase
MTRLSSLPSVERLLQSEEAGQLVKQHGRPLTIDAIRQTLDEVREEIRSKPETEAPAAGLILRLTASHLSSWDRPTLQTVINATGVILHTNLGRAPLSHSALEAISGASGGYSNLEFDLQTGRRGTRLQHAEVLLQRLLGVEAAVVVNNNASAVLLILSALASRQRVLIARSQLVEIGGGFRVPDVMRQSGAKLVEVGTTNKTRLADYEEALAEGNALFMHVHRSNFKLIGFTEEPGLDDLAGAAHKLGCLLVDDLGSGALLDTAKYGLAHEPTVQESLAAGADVVCFSGDKLLGGPQAGVILGKGDLIQKIRKHPLARAVRADKACLAGLSATLLHYLRDEADREIPVWRMIRMTPAETSARAEAWVEALGRGSVIASRSTVGGGSLPGESMKTYVLALKVRGADRLLKRLREHRCPIIARTEDDQVLLDPRTVLPEQDHDLVAGLRMALRDQESDEAPAATRRRQPHEI